MSRCQWGIRDPRTLAPAFNGASVRGCDTPGTHRKICQPCPCNTQNCVYAGLLFTRRGQGRSDARCAQAPGSPAVPMEGLLFSIHLHRTRIVVVAARLEQRSGQSRPGAAQSREHCWGCCPHPSGPAASPHSTPSHKKLNDLEQVPSIHRGA